MAVHVSSSSNELETSVGNFISERARNAIADHGYFSIGFSGGSSATIVSKSLLKCSEIDWDKWRIFFCDERYVTLDNKDSNYQAIYSGLLSKVCSAQCLSDNVFTINPSLSLPDAEKDYEKKLRTVFGDVPFPRFDLLLLGMGPDGHICSLFPNHPLLKEKKKWVAYIDDSPKPPPKRITLTLPVVNNTSYAVYIATGNGKASMVKKVVVDKDNSLPAAMVSPANGEVHWFLDEGAAELISK